MGARRTNAVQDEKRTRSRHDPVACQRQGNESAKATSIPKHLVAAQSQPLINEMETMYKGDLQQAQRKVAVNLGLELNFNVEVEL